MNPSNPPNGPGSVGPQPAPNQPPQPGPGYPRAPMHGPPHPPPHPHRPFPMLGCFAGLLVFLLVGGGMVMMIMLMATAVGSSSSIGSVVEKQILADDYDGDKHKIAVVTISGVITQQPDGFVMKQIRRVLKDEKVQAVVLRVESPGGTINGSDYYLHHLNDLKNERDIPIIVSMGSMATSGGYYVSMCGDRIFAERTTFTGSIGVIIFMYNAADLCEKIGVSDISITSGEFKGMGSIAKEMTPEEKKIWQDLVDEAFGLFKEVIREGRPEFAEEPEALDKLATGQIYTAEQALNNGLVDDIGFIEDAVDWAIGDAGLDKDDVYVVQYEREPTLGDVLFGGQTQSQAFTPKMVSEMTTPQAYYLCPRGLPIPPTE